MSYGVLASLALLLARHGVRVECTTLVVLNKAIPERLHNTYLNSKKRKVRYS